LPKNLIPRITLSKDESDRLQDRLEEMISEAEDYRSDSDWGTLHEQYWKQYLAEPDSPQKDWPWENASNLMLPLTQVACDAIRAQEFDAMLSNDPKVVGMEFSDYQLAEDLSSYYFDFYFKEISPLITWGTDWLLDTIVGGTGLVKIRQNQDYFVRRKDEIEEQVKTRKRSYEDPITGENIQIDEPYVEPRRVERATIEQVDLTEVENVDIASVYVAPDTGPSLEYPVCRWYYQKLNLTWDDMLERRRHGYDIPDDLKGHLGERNVSEKERAARARESVSESAVDSTIEVLEYYMRWPLPARYMKEVREEPGETEEVEQTEGDEDGVPEEIVVTYCPPAKKILLIRPLSRVTPDGRRPHVPLHYQRIPRLFYGLGVPAKLRHLNAAMNAQWNQRMNWGSLSVMPWGFYSPGLTDLLPDIGAIKPGQLIPTMDPRGVNFPRLQGDPNFWISADQQLQSWAEKVSNVSDYNLGRAPQTPNAPRTRGGQAMMLQQSNIGFSLLVGLHAQGFLEVFRRVHAFHKRYAKPGDVYRVLNKETGALQQKSIKSGMFDREVDFQFVLNPNRYLQQQQKQVLFGMTMQAMMQALQIPPLAQSIRTALADLYASYQMRNFDSIWPPELMPQIQQQQMMAQQQQMGMGGPPGPGGPPMQGNPAEMTAMAQQQASPLEDQFGYATVPETAMEEAKIDVG